jgi:hypothetical protein
LAEIGHDWMTLHRMRFPRSFDATHDSFDAPSEATCWRFCPSLIVGENGLPTWNSDVWGGLGLYSSYRAAKEIFDAPEIHLPCVSDAIEQWHALLLPIAHRGEVKWRDAVELASAVRPANDDPGGRLVVITTAGYNSRGADQFPRIAAFMQGILQVVEFYGGLEANLCSDVFAGGFDERDGFTFSLWHDNASMQHAAYQPGVHRALMDRSRDGSLFDRSSFTRARLMASSGSWDGDALS